MPQIYGKSRRDAPTTSAEDSQLQPRLSRYGEIISVPLGHGLQAIANEGNYFKAINPTPGTGIAQTIQTTFLATNGVFSLRNSDTAGGKQIFPDYLRLICTVVGASTTRSEGLIAIDTITRYASGGSAITPVNVNSDSSTSTKAVVHFGALTLAAEGGGIRRLCRFQLRTAIMVAFEEWIITFGRPADAGAFNTLSGSAAQRMVVDVGPVVIGPTHALTFHLWNTANAATPPSWEFEAGWFER